MALTPSPVEQGLWINADHQGGGPGVHALIIGVSRYDHLAEGAGPAPQTYGLGQLSVSALTAYRFFTWLCGAYTLDGWPVSTVRLLMSPQRQRPGSITTDELDGCDPAICGHAREATFANCQDAIQRWYAGMQALQAPASGRSLFLFSGHGMERRQNYQLLLPSDYLHPPSQPVNEAISTSNLADAISYLPRVASHVLLLDGCRNDIDQLRGAKGTPILDDEQPVAINPLFEKGMLYATASGLRAYSPKSGGLSLFGQALLDGLSNQPQPVLDEAPIELNRRGLVATIEINKLGSYMKGRVAALIKVANESVVQVVRSEVASSDPGRPIELAEIPIPREDFSIEFENVSRGMNEAAIDFGAGSIPGAAPLSEKYSPVVMRPGPNPYAWFGERYQASQKAVVAGQGAGRQEHIDRFHTIFGSEAITFPWLDKLQIIAMSTHQTFDHRAVELLSSAQAHRTSALHRVQIDFRIAVKDPIGHLMVIEDERQRRFCCVLPCDTDQRRYSLEIDAEGGDYINFATYLSPQNHATTGRIGAAWEQLRASDALIAARSLQYSRVTTTLTQAFMDGKSALQLKARAPLGALVACILLLKANQFDWMENWAYKLAIWFPTIPDGVVLWTEQGRRMAGGTPSDPDLLPWFVRELSQRSLPFTADGFSLAADLVSDILRGRLKTDDATRTMARGLANRLDAAEPYFRDMGLFCTYAGFPADWDPAQILGPLAAPVDSGSGPR